MAQKKHILLTTDLSEESMRAFAPVGELAQQIGARVTLMTVVYNQAYVAGAMGAAAMPVARMDPAQAAEEALERLGEVRAQLPPKLEVDVQAEIGNDVATAIVEHAERHGVDLIAMATHGRSGVKRMLVGSIAEAVLRHASVPLLLFPPARES